MRGLLDGLRRPPFAVIYTHSDWDHVFGGAEVGAAVIAHALTADRLLELAERDWSDEGLDRRVAAGLSSPEHAEHVKAELPAPRTVEVAPADVVFHDRLDLELGDVTVRVRHLGGDHSEESCVMLVEPDGVLFLGDCLYPSPKGVLTFESAARLRDAILAFPAQRYVEGHHDAVSSRAELEAFLEKFRVAERAARDGGAPESPDEDTQSLYEAFRAGLATAG